jgi:hypothetical protein
MGKIDKIHELKKIAFCSLKPGNNQSLIDDPENKRTNYIAKAHIGSYNTLLNPFSTSLLTQSRMRVIGVRVILIGFTKTRDGSQ